MPELLDHIAFLSQEIGPRPAGTEEEQQAALYITEQMQKEAGLSTVIEDFNTESNEETPKAICAFLTVLITALAIFFPILAIPSVIVTIITAVVYVLESYDRPIIAKLLTRGVSQNVVAKYEPGYSPEAGGVRRRKIVLVANYDSGKVRTELNTPLLGVLPLLQRLSLYAMVFIPVFLLVRYLFFLHTDGIVGIVLNVITVIALIIAALPVIFALLHKFSAYNEAANCNASGIAVLLEVARQVGRGRVSASELSGSLGSSGSLIYGEDAARSQGLVPEGARIVYEASQMQAPEPIPQTEEDRLAAAKDAIAAMTGRPIPRREKSSLADNLVQVKELPVKEPSEDEAREMREETRDAFATIPPETLQEAQEHAMASAGQGAVTAENGEAVFAGEQPASEQMPVEGSGEAVVAGQVAGGAPAVPDWFRKAQEQAKRPKDDASKVQRSRYADALDAAVAESSSYFNKANNAVSAETEERLRKMRDGIMEVSAPQVSRESAAAGQETGGFAQPSEQGQPAGEELPPAFDLQNGQSTQAAPQGFAVPRSDSPSSTIAMQPINVDDLRDQMGQEQQESPIPQTPTSSIAQAIPALSIPEIGDIVPQQHMPQESQMGTSSQQQVQGRRPIVLPDIGITPSSTTQITDTVKQQRAPLAVAEESSQDAAKSLLTMLPSIDPSDVPQETGAANEAGQARPRPDLRNSLPSLSGAIRESQTEQQKNPDSGHTSSVSTTGSFASVGATGAFMPVSDELLDNVDPNDVYIDDADDSVYEEGFTETGAFAGPGYVDMPKSRARKLFGKLGFRKDKNVEPVSTQQWLDVDEGFDARSVGASRGGWESFNEDQGSGESSNNNSPYGSDDEDEWQGGAFSKRRMVSDSEDMDFADSDDLQGYSSQEQWPDSSSSGELQQIYQFRHPDLDTEIWFVALGSELANNGGMRAFLTEHEQDLRGAVIINLKALGTGNLSYLEKEGLFGKAGASSRMKRYVQKASQNLGISIGPSSLLWANTAASIAVKRGFQAMSVFGMHGTKPARFAQGDDVLENIDESLLQQNTDFVMELIKNI